MKKISDKPTPKRLVIDIHPKMHANLKKLAIEKNETLKSMLVDLLDAYILQETKK